ncbi:HU family DNA-binding protein [Paracoccaceae bacterium Fryx2]|nr:HU family DNA-binding protein [Paracoccaceae bacterium Fryx2]
MPASKTAARSAKAGSAKTAASRAAAEPGAPVADDQDATPPAESGVAPQEKAPTLKLKDLIDRVVQATGGKKKGVREIVEATLATLGAALSAGDDLNLPPLGRAKVNRQMDRGEGELLVIKLHRNGAAGARKGPGKKVAKETLAEAED